MKRKILKLNKNYMAAGVAPWKEIVKNIFTESVFPLDMQFGTDDDGVVDFSVLSHFAIVKTWEEWLDLEVRDFDDYVHTPTRRMRLPSVVVCADYDKISFKRGVFPTRQNIWKRDNYTCGYTGKKLSRDDLTIDHITPKSLGGEDSWFNLITCDKAVNHAKGNVPLGEAKYDGKLLKLRIKPTVPKFEYNQIVFENFREEWKHFVEK